MEELMNQVWVWLSSLTGWEVTGVVTFIIALCGLILAQFDVLDKIGKWFTRMSDILYTLCYNFGVLVTSKMSAVKKFYIGVIWKHLAEPILRSVLGWIPNLIAKACSGLVDGLNSDDSETFKSFKEKK
ncbi:MAG: hypothetical protein WCY30_00015 [Candidatus Neomarinimicrobiota bacterium]|jgi:hypothetical protein